MQPGRIPPLHIKLSLPAGCSAWEGFGAGCAAPRKIYAVLLAWEGFGAGYTRQNSSDEVLAYSVL